MNKLWRSFKIAFHKFNNTGYSELMGWQDLNGKFRVRYVDGELSCKMAYSTAKSYSDMFGGEVIYWRDIDH